MYRVQYTLQCTVYCREVKKGSSVQSEPLSLALANVCPISSVQQQCVQHPKINMLWWVSLLKRGDFNSCCMNIEHRCGVCVCVHVAWLVDTGGRAIDVEHTLSPHSLISGHFTLLCVFIYLPIITLTLTLAAFEWITLIWPLYCVSPALVCFHVAPYSHGGIGGGGCKRRETEMLPPVNVALICNCQHIQLTINLFQLEFIHKVLNLFKIGFVQNKKVQPYQANMQCSKSNHSQILTVIKFMYC